MTNNIISPAARYIGLMVLVPLISGNLLSSAFAEQAEHGSVVDNAPELSSQSISKPLTDFETMELHYRRYSNAANNMAQLVKQLNQKIQDVSLASKTAEAKSSTHNKRLLEDKLRQLENARTSSSHQYALLQSQMQNESRSYTATSNNLKARYGAINAPKTAQETVKDVKTKSAKGKDSKTKDSKTKKEPKTKDSKTLDPQVNDSLIRDPQAKVPQLRDLETQELRARRDTLKGSDSGQIRIPTPGPTLNILR